MPETQLGSMRLGSVDMLDEEREGKTGVAPLIHIADGQSDELLADIALEYIIDDTHRQSLEDTLETYEFYTFGDQPFTQHLKDRNRIIIPDEDGTLREFIIYESEKYRDTEGYKMYVIGTASYLDLKKANVIRPGSFAGTASQHIGIALNDTEWRPGVVEVSGSRTIHRNDFTNPFDYLKTLAREFEGELRFRIEHNGNRITGRFVDLLERIGEWRGREIEFGKDLDGIRRIENTERIVTALIGLGPEKEDGTRLEVFVEDTDALQRWGRPDPVTGELRHLIEVYEPESDREDMTEAELRQYTQTELNKRINAVVTYECSVVDLENVPGMENKQIRFGDTIRIKDTKFNPPLYIEARVFEQERSIKSKAKKDIKLGDYIEYTEEEINAIWNQLRNEIRRRLNRMAIVSITSTAGNVFKNAQGETELTARTFVNGAERDEDGTLYDYQWMRFDKDGNHDTDFYAEGKTITVTANDIDEKATYRVLVAYELEVINTAEITISNVFDGEDGEQGPPGPKGDKGDKGDPGPQGPPGTSVVSIVEYYLATDQNSGVTTSTPGWTTTMQQMTPQKRYLWNYERINFSDGTYQNTNPVVIGVYGDEGEEGRSIVDITEYYLATSASSGVTRNTSGWTTTMQVTTPEKKYLWNYEKITWNKAPLETYTEPVIIGVHGEKGEDGKTFYTWIKYADTPTSGMSDNPEGKEYIGIAYNKETPTPSTNYADYTWSKFKGDQGVPGPPGEDGQTTYTWVKYADDDKGNGMSDSPDGKLYIGLAFNKTTPEESNNPNDYTWSLMPQNIEIGGKNLLRNSRLIVPYSNNSSNYPISYSLMTEGERQFYRVVRTKTQSYPTTMSLYNTIPVTNITQDLLGQTVTFSFRARASHNVNSSLFFRFEGGSNGSKDMNYHGSTFQITTSWKTYSFTVTIDFSIYNSDLFRFTPLSITIPSGEIDNFYLDLCEFKIELGNKATDWTPAPEDVQAEIDEAKQEAEEAKQEAQQAKTTADGKNSVFTQPTAPPTTGRKIGDVWFDTSRDNLMHRFNGVEWVEAKWGEQSIVANSITANHIKSLVGLNVNDQFVVDSQGNVKFAGELDGAGGVFSGEIRTTKLKIRATSIHDFDDFGFEIETAQWQPDPDEPYRRTGFIYFNTGNDALEISRVDENGNFKQLAGFLIESEYNLFTGAVEISPYSGSGNVLRLNGGEANHVYIEFYRDSINRSGYIGIPFAGANSLEISSHGLSGGIRLTGGDVHITNKLITTTYGNTTPNAPNVYIASDGVFYRSTSSERYKQDIQYEDVDYKRILNLRQASWYDKGEVERNEGTTEGLRRYYGAIAEDFERIGLPEYIIYNEETGEVENFSDRAWVLLIPNINDILEELEQIKERLERLENEGNSV